MKRLLLASILFAACSHESKTDTGKPTAGPASSAASSAAVAPPVAPASSAASSAAAMMTPAPAPDTIKTAKGDLVVHPIYHATMFLDWQGKEIVIDPWSKAGSRLDGVPKADLIFITDIHFDHLDVDAINKLKKDGTVIVAPQAVADQLKDKGITVTKVMHNGDKANFDAAAFTVEAIPMYNLTRGPEAGKLFHDKGRGNGYIFTFADKRVYDAGDTECTPEMKALKGIDVAFVPMNLPYTMPPSEAAECVKAFKPKILYPFHYQDSNLDELDKALGAQKDTEVRKRAWY